MPLFLPHFDLQKLNTLGVSSIAQTYVAVHNEDELREALTFVRTEKCPFMILGGGSNIVLRNDFPGLVIHVKNTGKSLIAEDEHFVWLKVAAGENWHQLVEYTLAHGFYGLENLSLIPGTVGAAPIQNIGAYGVEVNELIAEVEAIEIRSGLRVNFTNDSCLFSYRDSIFKQTLKDQYVISAVTFQLRKHPQINITYPALRAALGGVAEHSVTPEQVSAAVIAVRQSKLPDPAVIPNVGSFFKNPIIDKLQFDELCAKFPDMVYYPMEAGRVKLAAGWLIDRAGWRGKSVGDVCVHAQQALVLTNPAKVSGRAVLALAEAIQESVMRQFGVTLEIEPRIYP